MVYHLAAQPGISATTPFEQYERNNMVATHRLVEAAVAAGGVEMFINVATSSIYGAHATDSEETAPKPTSHYGATKLGAEQLVMAAAREGRLRGVLAAAVLGLWGARAGPRSCIRS